MGFPEQQITVSGEERESGDGTVTLGLEAEQGGKKIIKNGEAELRDPKG
jgi:hypothetical protein